MVGTIIVSFYLHLGDSRYFFMRGVVDEDSRRHDEISGRGYEEEVPGVDLVLIKRVVD